MQIEPTKEPAGSWWQRAQSRGSLKRLLWLINGCLVGVLLLFVINRHTDNTHHQAALKEAALVFDRTCQATERRMESLAQLQADLNQDLLQAGAASVSKEIKPTLLRPQLRRLKTQLQNADSALAEFQDQLSQVGARHNLRLGMDLLTADQRQELNALVARLEAARQEVIWLDNQLDGVILRWAQLFEQESNLEKAAQERQIQLANAETARANGRVRELSDALQRAEAKTEQVRLETLQEATLAAVQHLQTSTPGQAPAPAYLMPPAIYPQPPIYSSPYVYGHPYVAPVYSPVYPRHPSYYQGRSCSPYYSGNYRISYGCNYPRTVRIGPYLVVN